jgi:hypothetical protein
VEKAVAVLGDVVNLFPRAGLDPNLLGVHGLTVIACLATERSLSGGL